jgi:hypothetical protein
MTSQNAKELLPIITAFANGETIQVRIGEEWQDRGDLGFNLGTSQYRIKPVPHDDKWAMQQMKAGKKVRRRGWRAAGWFEVGGRTCSFACLFLEWMWGERESRRGAVAARRGDLREVGT